MHTRYVMRDELEHVYRRFRSAAESLPEPLRELAVLSRHGLSESNVMLCLPYWLLQHLDLPDSVETARTMSLANYFGTSFFLAQDRVIDSDSDMDSRSLLIANVYFAKWLEQYRRLFSADSSFWNHFDEFLAEYCNSVYWDTKPPAPDGSKYSSANLIHLGHKFSPTKICCAGMALLAGREDLIASWSQILDTFHIGYQMRDDYLDWKSDLEGGRFTYFHQKVMEAFEPDAPPYSALTPELIEQALLKNGFVDSYFSECSGYLTSARESSARIGCDGMCGYLDDLLRDIEGKTKDAEARRLLQLRIDSISPGDDSILFVREHHRFEVAGEQHLFMTRSMDLFHLDRLSSCLLDTPKGSTIGQMLSRWKDSFALEDIRESLAELITANIFGFLPESPDLPEPSKNRSLRQISLNVTHNCNLKCVYCYGNEGGYGSPGSVMSREIARLSIDLLMELSEPGDEVTVIFFGGEPLLCRELIQDAVNYAKAKADSCDRLLRFSLTSNGVLLDSEMVSFLDENDIGVQVSIDGPPDIQNRNRPLRDGSGSYETVAGGISGLMDKRKRGVNARCTVASGSFDLVRIVTHLSGLGFKDVHMEPAEGGCGVSTFQDEDYRTLMNQYRDLADNFGEMNSDWTDWGVSNFTLPMFRIHRRTSSDYLCGAGRTLLAAAPNGDLYPCHRFVGDPLHRMGNIRDWDSRSRDPFFSLTVNHLEPCSSCWARYLCSEGCLRGAEFSPGKAPVLDERRCGLIRHVLELALGLYCRFKSSDSDDSTTAEVAV